MQEEPIPVLVAVAAVRLGCRPSELLAWRVSESEVAVIGPRGGKYTFATGDLAAGMTAKEHAAPPAAISTPGDASAVVTPAGPTFGGRTTGRISSAGASFGRKRTCGTFGQADQAGQKRGGERPERQRRSASTTGGCEASEGSDRP